MVQWRLPAAISTGGRQLALAETGRGHHHQFAVAIEPRQGEQGAEKNAMGRNDHQQRGDQQRCPDYRKVGADWPRELITGSSRRGSCTSQITEVSSRVISGHRRQQN